MIVKFLRNKGGGSAGATMDYLLGKDRDRPGAILLSGDPELTVRIAENLDFKNRYTVGVLSFEESDLEQRQKEKIMESFEKTVLAGLERDQYDITWIEHRDKGRLELNFVIPNVELSTGKRLQPYYDKADRPLVENWKQVTNFEHGLSDPHAPDKAQAIKVLNSQNLPESVKEIKEQIGAVIADQISKGEIENRKGVVKTLEDAGFEITRQTERSISIKNPDGKRNIRLEGVIYENRQFDKQFAEEHSRAGQDYQGTSRERYQTALGKLQSLVESKQRGNREHFKVKPTDHQRPTAEHQKGFAFEYSQGGSSGRTDYIIPDIARNKHMDELSDQGQEAGISRNQSTARANPVRKTNFTDSGISRGQGQQNLFHRSQEKQRGFNNQKITNPFDNPFNHGLGDGEVLQRTELLKQPQTTAQAQQTVQPQESEHAKRLHEQLQRHLEHVGKSVERAKRNQSESGETDREIDRAEQRISKFNGIIEHGASRNIEHEREIKQSEQTFNAASRGIIETEQHISERAIRQEKLEKQQSGIVKGR